jgi:hypothetical protein
VLHVGRRRTILNNGQSLTIADFGTTYLNAIKQTLMVRIRIASVFSARSLKMRIALAAAVTGCFAVTCALADDHLEPCQGQIGEYESRVEGISRAAMPGTIEFVVTVIPSFQPEWSVGVSADKGHFLLTHVVFRTSLWGSSNVQLGPNLFGKDFSKPHIKTTAKTANVSQSLYEALRSEWDRSIAAARPTGSIGLDGEIFYFQ